MDWFAEWIGEMNIRNADLKWWAYSSTSKNFLSSMLGSRVLEVLAIRNLAHSGRYRHIYVSGATGGQMKSLSGLVHAEYSVKLPIAIYLKFGEYVSHALAILRTIFQAIKIWGAFQLPSAWRMGSQQPRQGIVLFTYVDSALDSGGDRYFGDLPALIREREPASRTTYVAYVYTPYRRRLREMSSISPTPYIPLYQYLTAGDLLQATGQTVAASILRNANIGASHADAEAMKDLLREALLEDVSKRGYLHNLLVYAGVVRMVRSRSPRIVIYPYENKSLEKMLLLAARAASPTTTLIGYQHTSITPRHIGLRFGIKEAATTPLPDRIVTAGNITRSYLEKFGNYPSGMLVTGCALRQSWNPPFSQKTFTRERPKVLLALSSSVGELVSTLEFMRQVKERLPGLKLGVRPHINFPLQVLPAALRKWVKHSATDLTGTSLQENLAWADLTAYISSTVALESLMMGRPVVYLQIDPSNPDPLLGNVHFRWSAANADEFLSAISSLAALSPDQFSKIRNEGIEYVRSYLAPKSPEAITAFLQ